MAGMLAPMPCCSFVRTSLEQRSCTSGDCFGISAFSASCSAEFVLPLYCNQLTVTQSYRYHADARATIPSGGLPQSIRPNRFVVRSKKHTRRRGPVPPCCAQSAAPSVPDVVVSRKLKVAKVAFQGPREEMEDEIAIEESVPGGFVYTGVFDGHLGGAASALLRDRLYKHCLTALGNGRLLNAPSMPGAASALSKAFVDFDNQLLSWLAAGSTEESQAGSTATVAFVRGDRLLVACVGDSRAVLSSNGGESTELTGDHRPYGGAPKAVEELARLKEAGSWVSNGRVCGALAISRAFGDSLFKSGRHGMLEAGIKRGRWTRRFVDRLNLETEWILAVPDVFSAELTDKDEFLLVATDGLWDVVRSSEAVRFVYRALEKHGDPQKAVDDLASWALKDRKSPDNTSIVLISWL